MCGAACRAAPVARTAPRPQRCLSRNAVPLGQRYRCDLRRAAPSNEFFFLARRRTSSNGRPEVVEGADASADRREPFFENARTRTWQPVLFWQQSTLSQEAAAPQHATRARRRRSLTRTTRHHGRQDSLVRPHQPPPHHFDQQLPQPARDALTQPEALGWRSGHAARPPVIATGAADGLGRRPIVGDAAAEPAAH